MKIIFRALVIVWCFNLFFFNLNSNATELNVQFDTPAGTVHIYDYCDGTYDDGIINLSNSGTTLSGDKWSGSAFTAIDGTGLHIAGHSFSDGGTGTRSIIYAGDSFTINTVSGSSNALLDAAMNFSLDGSVFVPSVDNSRADINLTIGISQPGGFYYNMDTDFAAIYNSTSGGHYVNLNGTPPTLYNMVTVTNIVDPDLGSGRKYEWNNDLITLNLLGLQADTPTTIYFSMWIQVPGYGGGGKSTFSNTFETYAPNPFSIISGPSGNEYIISTSGPIGGNASLFGSLELEEIELVPPGSNGTTVPEPASLLLFGIGVLGLFRVRRKFKK